MLALAARPRLEAESRPINAGGTSMTIRKIATSAGALALGALVVTSWGSVPAFAGDDSATALTSHHQGGQDQKKRAGEFVRIVRDATARYKDVAVAESDGYHLHFGCVSGSDAGAMGLHYVNMELVGDGVLDPARPEIVIYEPTPSGRLKLTGA